MADEIARFSCCHSPLPDLPPSHPSSFLEFFSCKFFSHFLFVVGIYICIQFELQQFSNYFSGLVFHPMNVPSQTGSFIDVACELVANYSCFFFHCLVCCFGLTALILHVV